MIDTSPLGNENATRGIGTYTRHLVKYLQQEKSIRLITSRTELAAKTQPDLVHYPYFDFFFNTLPYKQPTTTVVTIHDVIPLIFPDYYQPGVKGKLTFLKQRTAVQKADAIITDSESSKKDITEHLKIDATKIHVVYLGADEIFQPQTESDVNRVRRKYHLPTHYLLYVGDINYNKNLPQLIKALKFLPPTLKLVCVGKNFHPQPIQEWQWIETQLALSDVTHRVKFVTDVDNSAQADLAAIYAGSECYVQPSLYEGFGLPVLEAMCSKTPVVTTHNSSLIEVGGSVVTYASQPTAEAIAEAVIQVLGLSKAARQKQVNQAYQWSQQFSWAKTAQETLKVYQQVWST